MSLMRPTPGEMWDRIAILRVKIRHGKEEKKDVVHFEIELNLLMRSAYSRVLGVPVSLLEELELTHEAIWPLIETSPPELLRLNARRTAIREEIDKMTGEYRGPEKV